MRSSHNTEPNNCAVEETGSLSDRPQKFSVKQTEFLHAFASSPYASKAALCREIGISRGQLQQWEKNSAGFKEAMAKEYRRSQVTANMNRKTVVNGMLEAVEMAKDLRQPSSMITGWKEIARMCGYYEPERREIILSVDHKQLLQDIQTMPKDKLLELWHENQATPIEDAEFEVIDAP